MDINIVNKHIWLSVSLFCVSPRYENRYNWLIGLWALRESALDLGQII